MTKEQQDLAWACLSKEMKARLKERHQSTSFNTPTRNTLNEVFGYHNLTSDKEPNELLFVERNKVQKLYAAFESRQSEAYPGEDKEFWKENKSGLKYLFGDKCLPDKEPSVQFEPRFNVGDKVRKTGWDKDTTISKVEWHGTWETFVYQFKEQEYGFNCHKENDLTLVSKRAKDPDFSIGDKVQLKFDWCRLLKGTLLTIKGIPAIDRDNTFMYSFEETDEYIRETMLKPYTEP